MELVKRAKSIGAASFLFALPLVMSFSGNYQYLKLIFALIGISLLLLLWVVEMVWERGFSLHIPLTFWLGLLLVEAALISLVNSNNVRVGLESLGLLICFLLLYLLLVNIIRGEKAALILLSSVFAAAVLAAAYGLVQYYGWELFPKPHRIMSGIGSIISTMGNKNYLGGFLAYLYIPYGMLLLRAPKRWQKLSILGGMGLIWYTIMAIGARAIWLGLGVAAISLAIGAIYLRAFNFKLIRGNLRWIAALAVIMVAITALFFFPNPANKSGTVIGRVASGLEALAGPYVRYFDWWVTWEMIKDHPWIGIGLGDFKLEFLDYKARFLETERGKGYRDLYIAQALQAHNDWLQLWAELGTLGLLIAGGLVFTIFHGGWQRVRARVKVKVKVKGGGGKGDERKTLFTLVSLAGVISLMVHAFFSFPLHLPASALDLVLLLAILDSGYLAVAAEKQSFQLKPRRYSRWALVSAISILALVVISFATRDFVAYVYSMRGQAHLDRGDLAGAKRYLEESLRWDFEPKEALFYLGIVYTKEGDYRRAREALERSWSSYPRETTLLNLGVVALGMRDLEGSLRYLDKLTRIDPTDLDYLYEKADLLMIIGRTDEGLRILREITAKDENYYKAYVRLAEYYNDNGMREEAIENYGKALAIIKQRIYEVLERMAKSVIYKGEYEELKRKYEKLRREKEEIQSKLKALRGQGQREGAGAGEPSLPLPVEGSPDAPVTIVEFTNFSCLHCARFAMETLPKLEERYIEPGKVKVVFRIVAGEGPDMEVAEAALCADEQGAFRQYHDRLFSKTLAGEPIRGEEALEELAAEVGLDLQAFSRCLDSDKYVKVIEQNIDEAIRLGVRGTPTFFIDGRKVEGAVAFEEFQAIIEEELGRQEEGGA